MTYRTSSGLHPRRGTLIASKAKTAFKELNGYPMQEIGYRVRIGRRSIADGNTSVEVGSSGYYKSNTCIDSAVEHVAFYAQCGGQKVELRPTGEVWYDEPYRNDLVWANQVCRIVATDEWLPEVEEWMSEDVEGGIAVSF